VRTVSSRIEELERATGANVCRCGVDKVTGKPGRDVRFVIDTSGGPFVPKFCPECGRQVNFTFNIGTAGRGDE